MSESQSTEVERIAQAAEQMDWVQVVLNGGPPCFHVMRADGRFCGRAEKWEGHGELHQFVSFPQLLAVVAAQVKQPRIGISASPQNDQPTNETRVDSGVGDAQSVQVKIWLCELCLEGAGDECHTPGCALFLHNSPGHPIDPAFYERVPTPKSTQSTQPQDGRASAEGEKWIGHLNFDKSAIEIKQGDKHIAFVTSDKEASKIILAHNAPVSGVPNIDTQGIAVLAHRAYPGLLHSGFCSAHRENGQFQCRVCYPDLNALLDAHMKVSNQLYDDLLQISGLSDPPNGRIGTNKIVAEISRKLGIPPRGRKIK